MDLRAGAHSRGESVPEALESVVSVTDEVTGTFEVPVTSNVNHLPAPTGESKNPPAASSACGRMASMRRSNRMRAGRRRPAHRLAQYSSFTSYFPHRSASNVRTSGGLRYVSNRKRQRGGLGAHPV